MNVLPNVGSVTYFANPVDHETNWRLNWQYSRVKISLLAADGHRQDIRWSLCGLKKKALRIMGRRLMILPLQRDFHFSGPAIGFAFSYLLDDAVGSWPPSSRRWPARSRPANLPGRNGAPRPSPRSALATCG